MATNEKLKANEKFCMSISEASEYSSIGEKRLRQIAKEIDEPEWVLHIDSQIRVIRPLFEKWIMQQKYL